MAGERVVMLETASREASLWKTQVYEWFFPLQEWRIVTCRPTSLRATFDLPNG
jgi:hypothetical protein